MPGTVVRHLAGRRREQPQRRSPATPPAVKRCRVCSCTEENGCPTGCSWVEGSTRSDAICTYCQDIVEQILMWHMDSHDGATLEKLLFEVRRQKE